MPIAGQDPALGMVLHVMCESERYRDAPPDGGRDLIVVVVVAVVAAVPSNQGGNF